MNNWRARRIALGLSQQEVADRAGVAQSPYSRYERGTARPTPETAEKIEAALAEMEDEARRLIAVGRAVADLVEHCQERERAAVS